MIEEQISRCPECGSMTLKQINEPLCRFVCQNKWCNRFGTFDYIFAALKHYDNKIDINKIFELCYEGVNKE